MGEGLLLVWQDVRNLWPVLLVLVLYFLLGKFVLHSLCPSVILTGFPCPGCGMTRAAWLLMHGHPIQSLQQNPFLFVILAAGYMGLAELSPWLIGRKLPQLHVPNWALIALGVLVAVFTVARNVVKFL